MAIPTQTGLSARNRAGARSREAGASHGLIGLVLLLGALFAAVWLSPPAHYLQGLSSYLPLHTLLETFAVTVAALIFGLGWHAYSPDKPINTLLLACLFLAVALLDAGPFLSYPGMPGFVTPGSPQKAIDFWFAARLISAVALLAAAVFPWRPSSLPGVRYGLLGGSLALAALVYWVVLYRPEALPPSYAAGEGLTPFKIGAEYGLVAIHALTALALAHKLHTAQVFDVPRWLVAVCVMMLSELCFTLYADVSDAFNLLGPVYQVMAYGLLYQAMFADSVKQPYLRLHEAERAAWEDKERAEVMLALIGDAVISTGIDGRVANLNPVAESLTGWGADEARGRNLDEVFRLVGEETGEAGESPARRAVREGAAAGSANPTVLVSRDGRHYSIEHCAAPIRDRQGNTLGCVLVFHNVTEQREMQNRMAWHANHDALTGLPNRILLNDRLKQAIIHAQRRETLVVVCFMDIDRFKPINDRYGHGMGDRVLVDVANRLAEMVREGDTVARLGGDEFIVLLTDIRCMDQVIPVLQRMLTLVAPFVHDHAEFNLTASIGVSVYPFDDADADTLLRHADQAMYVVKESGRNGYHIFDAEQDKRAQTHRSQVERIRAALSDGELRLYYQPKVNMRSGQVVGLEALLRWQHPERGLVAPGEFLPLIEQSDLIVDVGEWVLNQAFLQMNVWLLQGIRLPVSVNIAARHLQRADFVAYMDTCLEKYPTIPPGQLELEILESAVLDDMQHVRAVMQACLDRGISFSLDDFGTGYSSLAYLKQLPAQTLKIDQTFVRDILDDPDDLALTEAVIGLSTAFKRKVIAEGVETAAHGVLLLRVGCDLAQGYGIARPMPPEAVPAWVKSYTPDTQWTLWSSIAWDRADFPLMVAQYDHLKWVKQVIDSLDGMPLRVPARQLLDSHPCRFGQWYRGSAGARYGHLPAFAELGQAHDALHQAGRDAVHLHRVGEIEKARSQVSALLDLNEKMLGGLVPLQRQVAEVYGGEGGHNRQALVR